MAFEAFGRAPVALSREQALGLADAVLALSQQHDLAGVMAVVRQAARALTGADGVTFVLREGELVHYADENAIARLWKGQRFPANACISGWVTTHGAPAVIDDVFADPRIPPDLYRPTFVRSLAMVPIRVEEPLGAIGAYWAGTHRASRDELALLEGLAASTALAMENTQLRERLQRAVAAREEFSTVASHELRTPLTPLKLQLEALQRDPDRDPEALRRAFRRMQGQVGRLERLADHLFDDARVSMGRVLLDLRETDLSELVRRTCDRRRPDFDASGTPLEVEAPEAVIGTWDPGRLERMVDNLLSNALRFASGRPVRVRVGLEGGGGDDDARADPLTGAERAELTVADGGPGIPPEARERVFARFERAASVNHFSGFGLGLWIVRQAVEAHRGEVRLDSSPAGTTLRVLLPLRR